MGQRVHQEDETKLKGTVTQAEKDRTVTGKVTAEQDTAASLKATVTQLAKDRTVTGTVTAEQSTAASLKATTYEAQQLIPYAYDYVGLAYTGDNLTQVTYKIGGSGGVAVAILTLTYTDSRLDSLAVSPPG